MKKEGAALRSFKHEEAKIAKDLLYGEDVIRNIYAAKTEEEVLRVMSTARIKSKSR